MRKAVRSITRQCFICRRQTIEPSPQIMGQLPLERVTPGAVFEKVGVDYAGPLYVKSGTIRRSVAKKAYVCLFVSLAVKAVHIELVSNFTTEAFLATLQKFIARRGYPLLFAVTMAETLWVQAKDSRSYTSFLASKLLMESFHSSVQPGILSGVLYQSAVLILGGCVKQL